MPALAWVNHHRLLAVSVGLAVVILAVAAGVWFFLFRDAETPIGLGQALRIYRQGESADADGRDPQLPPAGVYTYRTVGGEQLSVGGINRTFPAVTSLIVTDRTCSTMMWEPYVQHVEGLVVCRLTNSALGVASFPSSEEIAGIQTSSDVRCPTGSYFVPPDPRAGESWQATCHGDGETVHLTGRIVGSSSVTIGGRRVPALHTRVDLRYSGAETGVNPNEYWILMPEGTILRQRETVAMTQPAGPLGSVRYSETMGMTLRALTPSH